MDDHRTWAVSDVQAIQRDKEFKEWLKPLTHDDLLFLNLGCGYDYMTGWVNIDLMKRDQKVDVVLDLEWATLPFEDNSVGMITANHVLEHITNYIPLMREFNRVLAPHGILHINVPQFPCKAAVADPDHKRFFVPESFTYLMPQDTGDFDTSGIKGMFEVKYMESMPHDRQMLDIRDKEGKIVEYYFVELEVELEALKN